MRHVNGKDEKRQMDFDRSDKEQADTSEDVTETARDSAELTESSDEVYEDEAACANGNSQNLTQEDDEVKESLSGNEQSSDKDSDSMLLELKNISDKVDQLGKLFDSKIMHTAYEEKIVDQMHAELQKYKEDMYSQLVRPILMDIIEVRDSILRMAQTYINKPEEEQVIPLKTFSDYALDIQDILENNNINIYKSEEGESYTPVRQRVVKKVATPDEKLHGKIAESLSDGYEYSGKTISPEKITVYVYENKQ